MVNSAKKSAIHLQNMVGEGEKRSKFHLKKKWFEEARNQTHKPEAIKATILISSRKGEFRDEIKKDEVPES